MLNGGIQRKIGYHFMTSVPVFTGILADTRLLPAMTGLPGLGFTVHVRFILYPIRRPGQRLFSSP